MKGFLVFAALAALANSANAAVDSLLGNPKTLSPSFLAASGDLYATNQALAVAFAELGAFNDDVLDKVGDGIISLLEKHGYDFESGPDDMLALISFIDEQVAPKQKGFFKRVKGFFGKARDKAVKYYHQNKHKIKKEFKRALVRFVQHYLAITAHQMLPMMEKINENAVKTVPVQVRLVLAPILYNVWKNLFEHAHVPLPPNFSIEDFVCKGIEDQSCHQLLENIKNDIKAQQSLQPEAQGEEDKVQGGELVQAGDDYEDDFLGSNGGDFSLSDALLDNVVLKNFGLFGKKPKAVQPAPQDDLLEGLTV